MTVSNPSLAGHVSAATAYITYAYPFGSNRCLMRTWVDTADKGAKKGQQRVTRQTTGHSFNYDYTDKIKTIGEEAANAWALGEVQGGRVRWNAEKGSTYQAAIGLQLVDLGDGTGRQSVQAVGLSLSNAGPKSIASFRNTFEGLLTAEDESRLKAIEAFSRRYNPSMWAVNAA